MNKKMKIFLLVFMAVGVIVLGFFGGKYAKEYMVDGYDENKVAIRVELPLEDIDYDLQASLDMLKCKYEKEGKDVYFSYAGDLYPSKLNDAKINVFARGYAPGLDKRIAKGTHNVYFVHRFVQGYMEEFRNFDQYIATSKDFVMAGNSIGIKIDYLEPVACEHEKLDNRNANKILYIYEDVNRGVIADIKKIGGVRAYDSISFNSLSKDEKIKELLEAKVVVFDGRYNDYVRGNKVAYAVYDILSYGKDVITNWNDEVEKLIREGKNIRGFRDYNELFTMLLYGVFRK